MRRGKLFRRRNGFWWDASWDGVFGEGRYSYTFRYDKLALVLWVISITLVVIGYIIYK